LVENDRVLLNRCAVFSWHYFGPLLLRPPILFCSLFKFRSSCLFFSGFIVSTAFWRPSFRYAIGKPSLSFTESLSVFSSSGVRSRHCPTGKSPNSKFINRTRCSATTSYPKYSHILRI